MEHLGLERLKCRAVAPGVGRKAGLLREVGKRGRQVPALLRRDLRQKHGEASVLFKRNVRSCQQVQTVSLFFRHVFRLTRCILVYQISAFPGTGWTGGDAKA